jgi:hypothetical protein
MKNIQQQKIWIGREAQIRKRKSNRQKKGKEERAEKTKNERLNIHHKTKHPGKSLCKVRKKYMCLGVVFSIPGMQSNGLQLQSTIHIHSGDNIPANGKKPIRILPFCSEANLSAVISMYQPFNLITAWRYNKQGTCYSASHHWKSDQSNFVDNRIVVWLQRLVLYLCNQSTTFSSLNTKLASSIQGVQTKIHTVFLKGRSLMKH